MRPSVLAAVMVALMVAAATAQPCIECKDCRGSDFCLSKCQRSCPKRVDIDLCKRRGKDAGWRVAKSACETALLFCKGGQQQQFVTSVLRPTVTIQQCGNAAQGVCIDTANTPWESPCGWAFDRKVDQCSKGEFKKFYTGLVTEGCNKEADRIERELGGSGSGSSVGSGFKPDPNFKPGSGSN